MQNVYLCVLCVSVVKNPQPRYAGQDWVNQMLDGNDGVCEVLGTSIELQKNINATPPEGLWLLPDRHLAIGQKRNTHSVNPARHNEAGGSVSPW